MELTEFEKDGFQYRIMKLNAIKQFHLSRKISPLLPPLIPVFLQIRKSGGVGDDLDGIAELLGPFADGLAEMEDAKAEDIFNTCLSAVQRHVGDNKWAKIWYPETKVSQFEELNDLATLIPFVVMVIKDTLGPFMAGLITAQAAPETPAATA